MLSIKTKTSSYNILEPGKKDNKVKINMKRGGMAKRKLKEMDAARSLSRISRD
jgi:hypothetical protein